MPSADDTPGRRSSVRAAVARSREQRPEGQARTTLRSGPRGTRPRRAARRRAAISGEQDLYLFREGTHARLYEITGMPPARGRRDASASGRRTPRACRCIGDWNGWNADAHRARAARRRLRLLGRPGRRARARAGLQVPDRRRATADGVGQGRPVRASSQRRRPRRRRAIWDLDYAWGDDAHGWRRARRATRSTAPMSIYEVHLGLLAARRRRRASHVPRDRGAARRLRRANGLHARRADADHRASVLRLVGLPDDRLFRADRALRNAAGLHVPRRRPAPARHRRDPRLGAVALSRTTRTGSRYFDGTHLYEHADPRQGFHPEWNSLHLQLRPQRGARVPRLVGACSGSTRYHVDGAARGCGRVDALPRLRAQARASGFPNRYGGRENLGRDRRSCGSSTKRSTAIIPTCRSSPRSRRPGRWSRGPSTSAGSASA